jgi:1-phosphatidylinositol-4-phosphate 5-kinase
MNDNELKLFRLALPDYVLHLAKNHGSLIARIYGVYTVTMEDLVPVHLLLMANSAQVKGSVEYCFDLKGSLINREVKKSEIKKGGTLKDVNLLKVTKEEQILNFRVKD